MIACRTAIFGALLAGGLAGSAAHGEDPLRWERGEEKLSLLRGDRVVWGFGLDSIYRRPHFHPLTFPDGTAFTDLHPADHPWHLGLWFQLKTLNGLDYWQSGWKVVGKDFLPPEESLAKGQMGEVRMEKLEIEPRDDFGATIRTEIAYAPKKGEKPILVERRVMEVTPPGADGGYQIDIDLKLKALAAVTIDKHTYGGLHVRFLGALKKKSTGDAPGKPFQSASSKTEPPTPSRFMRVECELPDGKIGAVCLMGHPANIHHPAAWWLPGNTLGAVLTARGDIELAEGQELKLGYRLLVMPGPAAPDAMDKEWKRFSESGQ